MSELTRRLERDLREIAAGAHPSPSAWESIAARLGDDEASEVSVMLAPASSRSKRPAWFAAAAAAVILIGGSVAVVAIGAGDDSEISTADPDETEVEFPALTTNFVSPRNGFSIRHPEGATVTPATQLWQYSGRNDDGRDVVQTGSDAVFKGTSTDLTYLYNVRSSIDEMADEQLLSDYVLPDGCGVPRSQQAEITIDGQSGRIAECSNHIEATVIARSTGAPDGEGRFYLFTLSHDRSDARAVFDAFVATIDLTPETAVDVPADTVVSPTYGYSFPYSRGHFIPARERWDPSNEPVDDLNWDPRFDSFVTGSSAAFYGASIPTPDAAWGIDEWVDEYVTPTAISCGIPRSQQAEIDIDGQPGTIAECQDWALGEEVFGVEVTVAVGGRLYLFIGGGGNKALIDTWIASIELTPETAAVP